MINNIVEGNEFKLNSVRGSVYEPVTGWSYSHHAHITFFKGKFWAIWSNGRVNEDDLGQRVMMAESLDGVTWTNLHPVVTPEMLGDATKVVTAAGFHINGEILNLYYGSYNYSNVSLQDNDTVRPAADGFHENTDLGFISTEDCVNWTKPKSLGISIIPNHGPQRTNSGRLIISGNIMFPYTDNPNGLDGYKITGIYGEAFGDKPTVDDSETIHHVTKFNQWDARLICEGSFYQTNDNVLHMLLRSNSRCLWHSESSDDGTTWSEPKPTEYSDDGSKFHFGKLPDGRFYGVSNAKVRGGRCPLDLYLSSDGINFNKHYIIRDEHYEMQVEGMYKGGIYGYPHTLIHEGYMYVIYSKRKEAIEVTKFKLDQLRGWVDIV